PLMPPQLREAEGGGYEHERGNPPLGPWRNERVVDGVGNIASGVARPQHLDVAQILRPLIDEGVPVPVDAAAQDDEWDRPDKGACDEREDAGQRRGTLRIFSPVSTGSSVVKSSPPIERQLPRDQRHGQPRYL